MLAAAVNDGYAAFLCRPLALDFYQPKVAKLRKFQQNGMFVGNPQSHFFSFPGKS